MKATHESTRIEDDSTDLDLRLTALQALCSEMAFGILNVRRMLIESDNPNPQVETAVMALGSLGWIAERAQVVAGGSPELCGGNANAWLLDRSQEAVAAVHSGH